LLGHPEAVKMETPPRLLSHQYQEGGFCELRLKGVLRTSPVERACALFGKDHVWAFADEIKRARQDLMIFRTYLPSPRLMNTRPKCRKDFEETYQEIKNFLMVRH
jgi:hypothetical protein